MEEEIYGRPFARLNGRTPTLALKEKPGTLTHSILPLLFVTIKGQTSLVVVHAEGTTIILHSIHVVSLSTQGIPELRNRIMSMPTSPYAFSLSLRQVSI